MVDKHIKTPVADFLTWINFDPSMPSRVWDGITYPFLNLNGCTVEVQEWIQIFIRHITMGVIRHAEIKVNPY